MNKYPFLRINEEVILEAVSFNFRNNIKEYLPLIQWEVKAVGESSEKIGNGKSIKYKINKKYSGKRVIFRAYIKQDSITKYPLQNLICDVERQVSLEVNGKKILIKEVTGPKEALVGDTVDLKVTKYNIDSNKVTESQKKQIKWDVKGIREEKKVFTDNKGIPFVGEAITFMIPESWGGQSVLLMPYLRTSTENISVNISVKGKNENQTKVTECFCGKKHIDLRNEMNFRCQGSGNYNCKLVCDSIVHNHIGYKSEGAGFTFQGNKMAAYYQLSLEDSNHKSLVFYPNKIAAGMEYLDMALDKGFSVVVGVNHTFKYDKPDKAQGHNEETTDHFVVIVGRYCENNRLYYRFWDVGTQNGESADCKFLLSDEKHLICSKTYRSDGHGYTVTQIRRLVDSSGKTVTLSELNAVKKDDL